MPLKNMNIVLLVVLSLGLLCVVCSAAVTKKTHNKAKNAVTTTHTFLRGEDEIGSGENEFDDDDDDIEGSGDAGSIRTSLCLRRQTEASVVDSKKKVPTYVPQCTGSGEFSPKQCDRVECWCVTVGGLEVPQTRQPLRSSKLLPCTDPGRDKVATVAPSNKLPSPTRGLVKPTDTRSKDDDIVVDHDIKNKINPMPNENNVKIELKEVESKMLERNDDVRPRSSIMREPGILAGVIGGAVIGLISATMLVMFIVYRMRKKDEGSYALDEPKASPSIGYTKSHDREFFA